jgi:hypothetical protein
MGRDATVQSPRLICQQRRHLRKLARLAHSDNGTPALPSEPAISLRLLCQRRRHLRKLARLDRSDNGVTAPLSEPVSSPRLLCQRRRHLRKLARLHSRSVGQNDAPVSQPRRRVHTPAVQRSRSPLESRERVPDVRTVCFINPVVLYVLI